MNTIIKVEKLSKCYLIDHQSHPQGHKTLSETLTQSMQRAGRRLLHPFKSSSGQPLQSADTTEEFWALEDISFEVNQGDKVGIIGRNGAGKSTLLKILSRITEPTTGRIGIKGRVASLLEVGTGFHPELSGRENIFLNGSILGMTKREIKGKFDEIVDFAGIEKFLDTPVKRYSSGMYVRLAFSVAAHLEPEILIVDEVLAVGDLQFQKKCIGKMNDVGADGRTVLFVSHNMDAIKKLCSRGILLNSGCIQGQCADIETVVKQYYSELVGGPMATSWCDNGLADSQEYFSPKSFYLTDDQGVRITGSINNNCSVFVNVEATVKNVTPGLQIGYAIYDQGDNLIYWCFHTDGNKESWPELAVGDLWVRSRIPRRYFNEGSYRIELLSAIYYREWLLEPGKKVPTIFLTIEGGLSDSPYWSNRRPGVLAPVFNWERIE